VGIDLLPGRPVHLYIAVSRCTEWVEENITCMDCRRTARGDLLMWSCDYDRALTMNQRSMGKTVPGKIGKSQENG
jgi:hypothetical protein